MGEKEIEGDREIDREKERKRQTDRQTDREKGGGESGKCVTFDVMLRG